MSLKLIAIEVMRREGRWRRKWRVSVLEGVAETSRAKREGGLACPLSWIGLLLKLCGLNLIGGFEAKIKFS